MVPCEESAAGVSIRAEQLGECWTAHEEREEAERAIIRREALRKEARAHHSVLNPSDAACRAKAVETFGRERWMAKLFLPKYGGMLREELGHAVWEAAQRVAAQRAEDSKEGAASVGDR